MKNKWKRLLLACMLVLTFGLLAGCASQSEEAEAIDAQTEQVLNQQAESFVQQLMSFDDAQLDEMIEEFNLDKETVYASGLSSWKSAKEDLGAYLSTDSASTEKLDDGGYRTKLEMTFENRACEFTLGVDRKMADVTEITFSPEYSLGEMMSEAAGNLVVGMGTVFVVLTLIMCVISLFKFIPQDIGQKKEKTKAPANSGEAEPALVPAAAAAEAEAAQAQASEDEIAAVIAAAVAAYEAENGGPKGAPLANGLVVRSIKRVSGTGSRRR